MSTTHVSIPSRHAGRPLADVPTPALAKLAMTGDAIAIAEVATRLSAGVTGDDRAVLIFALTPDESTPEPEPAPVTEPEPAVIDSAPEPLVVEPTLEPAPVKSDSSYPAVSVTGCSRVNPKLVGAILNWSNADPRMRQSILNQIAAAAKDGRTLRKAVTAAVCERIEQGDEIAANEAFWRLRHADTLRGYNRRMLETAMDKFHQQVPGWVDPITMFRHEVEVALDELTAPGSAKVESAPEPTPEPAKVESAPEPTPELSKDELRAQFFALRAAFDQLANALA